MTPSGARPLRPGVFGVRSFDSHLTFDDIGHLVDNLLHLQDVLALDHDPDTRLGPARPDEDPTPITELGLEALRGREDLRTTLEQGRGVYDDVVRDLGQARHRLASELAQRLARARIDLDE